jgi:hypothetical protein
MLVFRAENLERALALGRPGNRGACEADDRCVWHGGHQIGAKVLVAVWIGLLIFALALAGLAGIDLLGWVVTTSVWTDATKALGTASKSYAGFGGLGALIATYVVLLVVLTNRRRRADRRGQAVRDRFHGGFLDCLCQLDRRNYAKLAAATPADFQKFGINWSLRLANEGGYIIALIAGLMIANFSAPFSPKALRRTFSHKWGRLTKL